MVIVILFKSLGCGAPTENRFAPILIPL